MIDKSCKIVFKVNIPLLIYIFASVYLVLSRDEGGLGFSKESVGAIKSIIVPMPYFLPILSVAIGVRFGYRKVLFFAFASMSLGYFFTWLSLRFIWKIFSNQRYIKTDGLFSIAMKTKLPAIKDGELT